MKKFKIRIAGLFVTIMIAMIMFSSCGNFEPAPEQSTAHTFEIEPEPVQSAPDINNESNETDAELKEPSDLLLAEVVKIVDGDTIDVSFDGTTERIRLIGIDTPESVHPDAERNVPYGKIATEFTKEKLEGKTVELEFDVEERDRYGRLLAYVYISGVMFNKMLLDEGHASVTTYPPNVKYVDVFTSAQTAAREAGKGQWSLDELAPLEPIPDIESATPAQSAQSSDTSYIGTTNSYKFHTRACEWGQKISSHNAAYFATRDEAINAGFVPCKACNP